MPEEEQEMLIDRSDYLSGGVHIGMKSAHEDMDGYIFHVKKNQLAILDLEQTDERIREAARFLAGYDPEEILVVGRREDARLPVEKFSEYTGARKIAGRFMPGTLTNPNSEGFMEPEVVLVSDPDEDSQAIDEAVDARIPVVAIADSANSLEDIDIVIPANNKAGGSLATVYFLLAREIKDQRDEEFGAELEEFKPEQDEEQDES